MPRTPSWTFLCGVLLGAALAACGNKGPERSETPASKNPVNAPSEPLGLRPEEVVPIPSSAEIERSAKERRAAFLKVLHVRAPRIAGEIGHLCGDTECRVDKLGICSLAKAGDHSRACQVKDGGHLFRISQHPPDKRAYLTLWSNEALVEELNEVLGPAIGGDGLRLYRDVPFERAALLHHPMAGILEFGAKKYTPWHALVAAITACIGKPVPEDAYRDRFVTLYPPLTELYVLGFEFRVYIWTNDDKLVRGGATCVRYTDPTERTLIWSALNAGLTGKGKSKMYLGGDEYAGLPGLVYPNNVQVVDYPFDDSEQREQSGIGCWMVGFGTISEEELFEPLDLIGLGR